MRTQNVIAASAALLLVLAASNVVAQQPNPADATERARERAEQERERAEQQAQQQAEQARQRAQQQAEQPRERAEQQAERQRQRAEQQREASHAQSELEQELEAARSELQTAAREVARLSSQFAAPLVNGVTRGFRYAGQRAMLGVGIEDTERGVRVASVTPNGPAAEAGLKVGDTITAIEGAGLADTRVAGGGKQSPSELLLTQMANVDPGEGVKLRVLNEKGAERDVTVKVSEISPRIWNLPALPKGPNYSYSFSGGPGQWFFGSNQWGQMQLVTLTPALGKYFGADKGLLVVRGPEGTALGLRDGDVLLDIGGREPTTPEHALRILGSFEPGEPLKITIMREQRRQVLEVKVPVQGNPDR